VPGVRFAVGSGFCSTHEQMVTPIGEKVSDAKKFKCRRSDCLNPINPLYEMWCTECGKRQLEASKDLDYVDSELDGDNPWGIDDL
jgi:hypothetical protein